MRLLVSITNSMDMNLGDDEGQGGLVHCSPWGLKESDNLATEQQQQQQQHRLFLQLT